MMRIRMGVALVLVSFLASTLAPSRIYADHETYHLGDGEAADVWVRTNITGHPVCNPGEVYLPADGERSGPRRYGSETAYFAPMYTGNDPICLPMTGLDHWTIRVDAGDHIRLAGTAKHACTSIDAPAGGYSMGGGFALRVLTSGNATPVGGEVMYETGELGGTRDWTLDGGWGLGCTGGASLPFDVQLVVPEDGYYLRMEASGSVGVSDFVVVTSSLPDPLLPGEEPPPADPCEWVWGESMPNTDCLNEVTLDCDPPDEFWELIEWVGYIGCIIVEQLVWMGQALIFMLQWAISAIGLVAAAVGTVASAIIAAIGPILTGILDAIIGIPGFIGDLLTALFVPGEGLADAWDDLMTLINGKAPIGWMVQVVAFLGSGLTAGNLAGPSIAFGFVVFGASVSFDTGGFVGAVDDYRFVLAGLVYLACAWAIFHRIGGTLRGTDVQT